MTSSASSSTGSISLTGLLGGTAGSIDTTALITQMMTAAAVPQGQLYDQLNAEQLANGIYTTINAKLSSLQTAAQAITDPTIWSATAASSSDTSVVATSTGSPIVGSTTFNVTSLATSQRTTIAADSAGNILTNPAGSISVTVGGTAHQVTPADGSAASVAAAINSLGVGVKANVVSTDTGQVLQIVSSSSGSASAFTLGLGTGTWAGSGPVTNAAQDAQVQVGTGNPATGGYTITSSSNTFVNAIPGVTFTVSQLASNVSVGVTQDPSKIADAIKNLVTVANIVQSELAGDTQQGSPLQGTYALNSLLTGLGFSVSKGTSAAGGSLADYGIDLDKNGVLSFDASKFTAAYTSDPASAKTAATDFASRLIDVTNEGIDPTAGSITARLTESTQIESSLNASIAAWTDRLSLMKDSLTAKFTAMETTLATLQGQSTYINSMLGNLSSSSSSSKSS